MQDICVQTIGRCIVVAVPSVDWATIIFPFPFDGTKQISGRLDYLISIIEKDQRRRVCKIQKE
ncbi:MAG: hypothetical protein HQK96_08065 [Nitrospirae bacterium]|nr:hypothetical protein [Nitrospirota bacterium]